MGDLGEQPAGHQDMSPAPDHDCPVDPFGQTRELRAGVRVELDLVDPRMFEGEPELISREPMPAAQGQQPRRVDFHHRESGDCVADRRIAPVSAPGTLLETPRRDQEPRRLTASGGGEDRQESGPGPLRRGRDRAHVLIDVG